MRTEAKKLCERAMGLYAPHLDAHWNLARVQIDGGDFAAADRSLRRALEIVRNLGACDVGSLRRFGYDVFGERYTIWMLAATRFLSNRALSGDPALRRALRERLVGLQPDAVKAVEALLDEMRRRDLTVDDDRDWLGRMKAANYLRL